MGTASFDSRDPTAPEFWSERFERAFTPWDLGAVPQSLRQYVAASPKPRAVLIPGCGSGYEVACLSEAGWNVTALDFSIVAVDAAKRALGAWADRVVHADFFAYVPPDPVDFIYERAFLCALPPRMRQSVAARWADLLGPGGLLAGFFYFDESPKGPPFGISQEELNALLRPHFERIADEPVSDSLPVFAGKERWQIWRRRGD